MNEQQRWALTDPAGYRRHVREVLVGALARHAEQTEEVMTVYELHAVVGHPVIMELRELAEEGIIEQGSTGYRLSAIAELALSRMRA